MRITIECDHDTLNALRLACETYMRLAMGQFGEVAEAFEHPAEWDRKRQVEDACKAILAPHLGGGYYSIGNGKVSKTAKRCYNLWKLLGRESDYLLGGTVPPVVTFEE